jgi:hypothetical protein
MGYRGFCCSFKLKHFSFFAASPVGPNTRRRFLSKPPHSFLARGVSEEAHFGATATEPVVDAENLCFSKYDRTLDDVLQLAYVSGPRIGPEQFERPLVHAPDVLSSLSCVAIDEVFHQQRNRGASPLSNCRRVPLFARRRTPPLHMNSKPKRFFCNRNWITLKHPTR